MTHVERLMQIETLLQAKLIKEKYHGLYLQVTQSKHGTA